MHATRRRSTTPSDLTYPAGGRGRSLSVLLGLATALGAGVVLAPPADASVSTLCTGYVGCATLGMGNAGYSSASRTMYWRMYGGHNCTNYAAYRMIQAGMPNVRPWSGDGNATNWGSANSRITDSTPAVGSIAWWRAGVKPAGSAGHVAYVEKVVSPDEIIVSQDSWNGDFSWTRVTRTSSGWPSGFVHFTDAVTTTPVPTQPSPTPTPTPTPTPKPGPTARTSLTAPVVTGYPRVGRTVSAGSGTWSPAATGLAYTWLSGGVPVAGATGRTFVPGPAQVGRTLAVRVTATGSGLAPVSRTSAAIGPVRSTTQLSVTAVPGVRSLTVRATMSRTDGAVPTGTFVVRSRNRVLASVPVVRGVASAVVPDTTGTHLYRFRYLSSTTTIGSELLRSYTVR